nr:PREDICTED: putative pentatricopeptide repeat-containing protein At1g12700, mitochondrial [Daucus carota subsp. sativus]
MSAIFLRKGAQRLACTFPLFSTKPNPNSQPKPPFIPSPSTTHPELKLPLYQKSKVGFDKLDDALLLFDKMLLLKSKLSVLHFNQLLAALVRMKEYSVAVSMFREMRVLSIPVNIVTYTTAIHSCCHLNTLDYAFSLLAGIIKSGWVPDVVTYTTLIKGLLSQDRALEAEHLFRKLIRFREIQPDVVTYSTIIDGLCKTSNTSMALKLLRKMEKLDCRPDAIT